MALQQPQHVYAIISRSNSTFTTVIAAIAIMIPLLLLRTGGGSFKPQCDNIDVYKLDLTTMHWKTVRTHGDTPAARVAHSCAYDATDGKCPRAYYCNASMHTAML
jgi:hypothetical protein